MTWLFAGLALWSAVHLVPSLAPGLREAAVGRLGENGYKGLFSILTLAALAMMVFGWRGSVPEHLYLLPPATRHIGMTMVLVAFLLMGATHYPTRIKRFIRHPLLTGVVVWAGAHLMMNGDTRSVLLFGWLGAWALLEIILINRRDPEWVKPEAPGWGKEIVGLAISGVVFGVFVFLHPWIAGVRIM